MRQLGEQHQHLLRHKTMFAVVGEMHALLITFVLSFSAPPGWS